MLLLVFLGDSYDSDWMVFTGAWSLIGVLWGNHVGAYFDDFYMMNIIFVWDSYSGNDVTLYNGYPTYKTALVIKLLVSFVHVVVCVVTFGGWMSHVEYQKNR